MRRRYNLSKSDNYMYTGRSSYVCSGSGTVKVYTGFPVTRATVSFATIPCSQTEGLSSSSSSSIDSSSSSEGGYDTPCPRIYVSSYESDGFIVAYEGILVDVGYIEFNYAAV